MKNKLIKISGFNQMNVEILKSLNLLYMPLLKGEAINLYTTLMALHNQTYTSYEELSLLLQKTMQEVEIYRELLEEYRLVRTFVDKDEKILYVDLQKPLDLTQFITHNLYSRLLFNKLNEELFTKIKNQTVEKEDFNHLIEISKIINLSDQAGEIEEVEDKYQNIVEFGIEHQFDYPTFIKKCDPFGIPVEFVENKNILHKIGEYASIYNIDATNMAKLVAKSTILATKTLDFSKLVDLLSKVKVKAVNENTGVLHPFQFIKSKQQGIDPTKGDKQLIEKLITQYRLSYEFINLLIEYSLNKNDNRIVANYIETIALSWIRKNIKTIDDAKASLETKVRKTTTKKPVMVDSNAKSTTEKVKIDLTELIKKG